MCLGVPGRIVAIDGLIAVVDFWGMRREVRLEIVDEPVGVGDYILNHVGYAIRRIPEADIQGTLDLYEQLLREAGANDDDLMTADVRSELAATSAGRQGGAEAPPLRTAASDRRDGPSAASDRRDGPSAASDRRGGPSATSDRRGGPLGPPNSAESGNGH